MTFKHSHQPSQHRLLSAHILTYHSCTQSVHVNMDSSSQTIHPQVADEEPRRHQDEQQQSRSLLLSDGVIRAIFLLLGVGILIPWNAFVSAKPYFTARLCQASGQDIVNFEQWFGLIWNTSSVFSLGLLIFGQSFSDYWMKRQQGSLSNVDEINNNDDESNHSSSSNGSTSSTGDHSFYHVMVPLTIYATVFSVQAFLVTIPDISPTNFLIVTFVGLAICGTCGAIATAGIISTAGLFPSHIGINPFFSGQSLGGVVVSMANFGAAAVGEDPVDYLDKHCSSTNQTQEIIATFNSIISTEIRRMDLYLPQEEPPSCSPYAARDWAVFSYFLLGCIILIFCLVGYHRIHMYQNMKHRDDYETLHNHEQHGLALGENYYNDNVVEVDETSPRIGLEMNDRIYQREQNQNEQRILMIASTSEQSTNIANEKLTSNDEDSRETLTSLPDDIHTAEMTASSSNITCLPSLCGNDHSDDNDENQIEQDRFDDEEGEEYTDNLDTNSVLFAIKGPVTCVFLTFTVTLALFPSYISDLKSSHECENHIRLYNDLYVPFSFVLFNVGDLIGRILAEYIPVDRIKNFSRKLVACAILRIALVPLFLMCLTTTGKDNSMVIRSDVFSLSVQLLFAITNGLFVSTSFMWSPQLVGTTTSLQERASETMTLALYFGLLCGSFLAFPFMQFATRILEYR